MTAPLIDRMAAELRWWSALTRFETPETTRILAEYDRTRSEQGGEVTDEMVERAKEACTRQYGKNLAYFPPETDDEWRAALTAALKGDRATSGMGDG